MKLRRKRKEAIVPVNAMSDIAFLLLVFIMLITLINYRREVPIEYPEAQFTEITQADKNIELWVTMEGTYIYDGQQVSLESVEGIIADALSSNPSVRIHILADKRTHYKYINGIMTILQVLQHRVVSLVMSDTVER